MIFACNDDSRQGRLRVFSIFLSSVTCKYSRIAPRNCSLYDSPSRTPQVAASARAAFRTGRDQSSSSCRVPERLSLSAHRRRTWFDLHRRPVHGPVPPPWQARRSAGATRPGDSAAILGGLVRPADRGCRTRTDRLEIRTGSGVTTRKCVLRTLGQNVGRTPSADAGCRRLFEISQRARHLRRRAGPPGAR